MDWGLPAARELPALRLGTHRQQRLELENLGELYSLLVTTDRLERAYVRDYVSEGDYNGAVTRLIAQYKTLRESMGASAPDLADFCAKQSLHASAGQNRLRSGVPATLVHGSSAASGADAQKQREVAVFHAVQHFITTMDALKLSQRAVDELQPTLTELSQALHRVPGLEQAHESRAKPLAWLSTLHGMAAHQEISEEQARQMSFDLDSAYSAFHRFVQGQ